MVTERELRLVRQYPHLLGHLVGKSKLGYMHSKWINYIWQEQGWRSLQAHRGSYKTTAIVIIGIMTWLLFHPNCRIGLVRENFSDAAEIVKNVAALMKFEEIQAIFRYAHGFTPRLRIDRSEKLVFNFKQTSTPEGNLNAFGITTSITGTHLDFVICDDFVTIKDKVSPAKRKTTKMMLEEIINNVLDPDMPAGFVGTPWHKGDAWNTCPAPLKFDVYSTGILTQEQILKKRRYTTNVTFAANYELKHVMTEGAMFGNPKYKKWNFNFKNGVGQLDAKFKGSDTNALTFLSKKPNGRYQGIGWVYENNMKTWYDFVLAKWKEYFIGTIYMEYNTDKGSTADKLWNLGVLTDTYDESMNKHVKIEKFLYENDLWNLIDWDPDTDPEYLSQILDYEENADPDDAPDSASSLGRIIKPVIADTSEALYER